MNVRSMGTRNVISAMRQHGVRKLVVQSSYGLGETRDKLRLVERLYFQLILRDQIADTEWQEREVRASGLDWRLVKPVHLTDGAETSFFASPAGEFRQMGITRGNSVGRFLVAAVQSTTIYRQILSLHRRREAAVPIRETRLLRDELTRRDSSATNGARAMARSAFAIIEAPSVLGLFPRGVERLPDALLAAGNCRAPASASGWPRRAATL